jgi:predicted protein tyrosine phosphatase
MSDLSPDWRFWQNYFVFNLFYPLTPDQYEYMDPDLVAFLEEKVLPLLGSF